MATAELNLDSAELQNRIERFQAVRDGIIQQVRRAIVGQDEVLEQLMLALFVGGHCLITGLPGTAKTLMVRTIAQTLGLEFKRIQFTPDLMPSDITGTDIVEEDPTTGHRTWTFVKGPIFGNVLLADEINRTPPKTQSALLEAMQEHSCTVRGNVHKLPAPFFVLATQNPIELEGTYPLPEAQLDRFIFNTVLDYLSSDDEAKVVDLTTTNKTAQIDAVTNAEEILGFQQLVRMVPIADPVARYAVKLVRATRHTTEEAPDFIKKYVNYGASVRAALFLVLAAKARALSRRRYHVSYEDVTALATPILRHRILMNFHAESERISSDDILKRLLAHMPPPAGS
jgi:MoxR-like ATPase